MVFALAAKTGGPVDPESSVSGSAGRAAGSCLTKMFWATVSLETRRLFELQLSKEVLGEVWHHW